MEEENIQICKAGFTWNYSRTNLKTEIFLDTWNNKS